MILTCPACATQYTVKDGAIPPAGRQVRCASCKHSWHQDSEGGAPVDAAPSDEQLAAAAGGPPQADPDHAEVPLSEIPEAAAAEDMIAEEPQPEIGHEVGPGEPEGQWPMPGDTAEPVPDEQYEDDEGFASIPAMHDEDEAPGRGRALGWLIGVVLLVIAAAAAFWVLAPADLKARAGIGGAGVSPLELMLTTSDRQKLASGNELVAISGRIINPTDNEQAVPPIEAELRNKATKKLVYKWTIAPPARSLPPRGSASFNSAEVDIPEGGDELTVTLGGKPS